MQLSQQALAEYRQQGFLVCPSVFEPGELDALRAAADAAAHRAAGALDGAKNYWLDGNRFADLGHITLQFEHAVERPIDQPLASKPARRPRHHVVRVIEPINDFSPAFDDLLDDPRLVEPMQQLLGHSSLALWTAKLNFKPARCGSGFGWHQDSPYWMHDSEHVDLLPNLLLAIDSADRDNGCLRVIPASHHQGPLPGCDDGRTLAGFYTNPSAFDEHLAVDLEVPAGGVILFDPHLIHGSNVNRSDSDRRALIATYQPAGYRALKSGVERPINPVSV